MEQILTLYFVRHTKVTPSPKDLVYGRDVEIDISNTTAFKRAAQLLPSPQKSIWVTSPFPRAVITAQEILKAKNVIEEPKIIDGFKEQNFGDWTGKTKSSLHNDPNFKNFVLNPFYSPIINGESGAEFYNRVSASIRDLLNVIKKSKENQAVVVCHAGTIRNARYYKKDLPTNPKDLLSYRVDYNSVHPLKFSLN